MDKNQERKKRTGLIILGAICLLIGSFAVVLIFNRDRLFYKKTSTGLMYRVKEKGSQKDQNLTPTAGQILLIETETQLRDGRVITSSNDEIGVPLIVPYNEITDKADGDIQEAISMLQKGDRYIFKLPAKALLGDRFETLAAEYKLKEDTKLYLHLYLKDITTEEGLQAMEVEYLQALIKKGQERMAKQLQKDTLAIQTYLKKHQLQTTVTPSGLQYTIHTPGQGASPQVGDIVSVNYVGKNLAGEVFDTNLEEEAKKHKLHDTRRKYEPMQLTIGEGNVIPGFEEGMMLLNKHAKATLWIPSVLAYGAQDRSPHIKPYTSLIFEVEMVDIHPSLRGSETTEATQHQEK